MSEVDTVVDDVNEVEPEMDYKAEILKLQERLALEENKKTQLLDEKKKEEQRRKKAEALAEQERAQKSGDYEALLKSVEKEKQEWEAKYTQLTEQLTKKEIRSKAVQLANELKPIDGDAAETLADYIERRIKVNEGSLLFLDANGEASVMDAESLKKEFKNSNKFKPLIMGSQATGGGAPGNNKSIANTGVKEMTYSEFSGLNPGAKLEFSKLVSSGKAKLI